MKRILILAALLLASLQATAADCFPSQLALTPGAGTPSRSMSTDFGSIDVWFCRLPVRAGDLPNKWYWATQFFPVPNKCRDVAIFAAAAGRVAAASEPIAQARAEIKAAACPIVGEAEIYEWRRLKYLGCKLLQEPASWPVGVTFDRPDSEDPLRPSIYSPDWCGAAPVPPPPPPPTTTQYIVTVTAAYPLKPDGTRSITRWPMPAIVGEPADGAVQINQFGARFCKVPRLSTATQTVVAGCAVKP